MRESIMEFAIKVYSVLLPISWIAIALIVFVLLPMCFFKRSRGFAGLGMIVASYIFGVTTWFLGAAITFGAYGWFGLIIGLLLFGIGVVPLAIIGAIFKLQTGIIAVWLIVMAVITIGTRIAGHSLVSKYEP